uniref:Glycosyltransferase n=1 Tax=Davidia involucrata TaxID=16924 RepID=A0A5B7A3R6_DAVIN
MDQQALPHVLIFPLPLQGPVNCMLKLAELLCIAGFHVTFLNTHHIQRRLLRHTDVQSRLKRYPGFRFESISDGLPEDHPRSGDRFMDIFDSLEAVTKPLFQEMLTSGRLSSNTGRPVTFIIADGILDFPLLVAQEIGIPLIYFDTISPCCVLIYLSIPKLIQAGELPFKGNDLDAPITSVAGMEAFLRRRDLPSFCRAGDLDSPVMQLVLTEDRQLPRAQGLILNTFEEIEGPILSHIRSHCPNLYAIGPLHAHLEFRLAEEVGSPPTSSNSLWEEDRSCMTWLDAQPLRSVIYVSFGSLAVTTKDQLMEFWHGLVNSGKRFLWVIRPNAIAGEVWDRQTPVELAEGTEKRGCVVIWAPQEEVLAHPAVGGFLTHSGWNSTLESIVAGVPMLCWPYFVDQQVNSRYVEEVWKLGIDMKDTCDRVIIEKMINDLMEVRRDQFMLSTDKMAKLARTSVSKDGSSYCNLDRLIENIRLMSL